MEGDQPAGGQWNFDAENRRPAREAPVPPMQPRHEPDAITREVLALVATRFAEHPGSIDHFAFAVTREEAEAQMLWFLRHALPGFGDWQDAMLTGEPFLWHSLLSPALNIGLIDPLELCRAVESEWRAGRVPINAAEGFIRQIIGWREYVRGIYWREGPHYVESNHLDARRPLPDFYWTGATDLNCLAQALRQTLDHGYAHHIQRLMITGNFALIAGIDPHALHRWYLAIYVDAFEWVEAPNTIGMSQFADGGLLGSKPYAAGGAYVNRMSDYCRDCRYDVKQRTGPQACPLNALYWDFLVRNRETIGSNPRLAMPYRSWDRFDGATQNKIRDSASAFLAKLEGNP
jgi:deoxyribodipyrimidine photolyase-related protein